MRTPDVLLAFTIGLLSSDTFAASSQPGLFDAHATLDVTLRGPLRDLLRADGDEEFPFTLTVDDSEVAVKLRQRGNFRRAQCRVPPMRVNFRKTDTGTPFAGQDKLKLVNPCGTNARDEQNLLDEYALYRIANLMLGATSFRVRLLHVTWQDSDSRLDWGTRAGFLIEAEDALAARVGAEHIEPDSVATDSLDPAYAVRVALFNYLAGNTDYSQISAPSGSACCHNGKVLRLQAAPTETVRVVPYDFDMAGAVGASYAKPSAKLNIRSVRQRLYRGFCVPPDVLRLAITDTLSLRAAISAVIDATPGLTARSTAAQHKYLGRFFAELERPDAQARLERACR